MNKILVFCLGVLSGVIIAPQRTEAHITKACIAEYLRVKENSNMHQSGSLENTYRVASVEKLIICMKVQELGYEPKLK